MLMPSYNRGYCHLPFNKIKIGPSGDVTNCCWMNRPLGNILRQPLEEIWNSPILNDMRQSISKLVLHASCRGHCPFNFKTLVHRDVNLSDYPALLEFDLPNTHCNIGGIAPKPHTACIMCSRASVNFRPSEDLSEQIAIAYAPYTKYLKSIHIQGIAEPLWKGKIFQILNLIQATPTLRVSVITNGILLQGDILAQWLQIPLTSTIVSLDAASPSTYKLIRKADSFDTILDNIRVFNERKSKDQILALCANINIHNVHEVESIVEIAASVNANYLELNTTDVIDDAMAYMVVNASTAKIFAEAQANAQSKAQKLGVRLLVLKPLSLNYPV